MYDLSWFGGGIVLDVMRTHPLVVGESLLDNGYCLTSGEYPNRRA
jgi:hypothetical protein